ncbi:hypothetical protein Scep_020023 [Stephania cephalantha]|uniref:Uncharacterized protein n=1 Tax=Stephania cephalantha TaxID=152367 RepID=A0AAP0IBU7_9MAGN
MTHTPILSSLHRQIPNLPFSTPHPPPPPPRPPPPPPNSSPLPTATSASTDQRRCHPPPPPPPTSSASTSPSCPPKALAFSSPRRPHTISPKKSQQEQIKAQNKRTEIYPRLRRSPSSLHLRRLSDIHVLLSRESREKVETRERVERESCRLATTCLREG